MVAPVTETFDAVPLVADGDSDNTRNLGGSERTINGWKIEILDASGNPAFSDPNDTSQSSYLDVTGNVADTDLTNGGGDNALMVNGYYGVAAAARFSAVTGEEFWLQSFAVQGYGMAPNARIVGYRDGMVVASQDIVIDSTTATITTTGAAWKSIDEFRIIQRDGTADVAFSIDDIVVSASNAPPVIGNLNGDAVTYTEAGAPVVIDAGGNATLADTDSADFSGGTVTVSIVANGVSAEDVLSIRHEGNGAGQIGLDGNVISYGGTEIGTFAGGTGTNDLVVTLNAFATAVEVQALLCNLTYANSSVGNPSMAIRTVRVTVDDGDGGVSTAADVSVSIISVNDAPSIVAPVVITAQEDVATALTGFAFSDADAGSGAVTVTLSVPSGTLSAASGGGVAVTGAGTGALMLTGTIVDINAFVSLGAVTFTTAPNATSGVPLAVMINDNGHSGGGALTATAITTIVVEAVNDAPINTVPGAVSIGGNEPLVFSTGNGNRISVADVDAGGNPVKVTLVATQGTLSLSGTSGLSFEAGDGAADSVMTFTGTLANINAALNGLTFVPLAGYTGAASISIETDDLGNAGSGGARIDTDTIMIDIGAPAPVVADVSSTAANGTYKIGDTITIIVSFDQAVNVTGTPQLLLETGLVDRAVDYVSGTGSNTLTFAYTVQAGDTSADLDYVSTTALTLNGGTVSNADGTHAILTLPAPGTADSLGANKAIGVDGLAPTVASVTTPANGIYVAGQNLDFTVNLSEAVVVDTSGGTPRLAVTIGTDTVYASYLSGSGTSALVFRLTLTEGLRDADGIALVGPLDQNGGTLQDAAGNGIVPTLNSVGATNGVLVDTIRPTAAITFPDAVLAPLETTTVTITFSEAVTGLTTADFTVPNGMLSGLATSDGGITWTATLTANPGVTDLTNVITLDMTGVVDVAGNAGSGTAVSANYAVDAGPPPNVPPTLTGDLEATVAEGGSYTITTADLNFSDPDDAAAGIRFTVSAASNGTVQVNGKAATSFTGAELAAGKVTFVHSGSESTKASFKVSVEDGNEDGSTPVAGTFNLTVTPVNDAPTLTGDLKATVKEGGSYTITTADLNFSDPDDNAAGVRFTVSAASNGTVQVNGKAATGFTGAELAAGKVTFVHSGSETTRASFKVSVEDGNEDGSTPVAGTFNLAVTPVNDAPTLTGDLKATVKEGGSYRITTADLNFSDPDDSAAGVRFTVSAASNGKIQVNGKAATSFTGAELAAGKVTFVHSGAESTRASFKVSVEDGNEDGSTPVASTFSLAVTPVNDAPELVATQTLRKIAEDASTASARKVATLEISDPDGGNNKLSLAGSDAKLFEIKNGALWLKKGAKLDYETNPSLNVTVRLDDPSIGTKHEDWQTFKVAVTDVAETKTGTSGKDKLTGTSASDVLNGKGGNDVLEGRGGNDILSGGSGNDRLTGGSGVDIMTGGSGHDTFVFTSAKDSAPGQSGLVNNGGYNPLSGSDKRDIITDFVHAQDKLDLSKIDADSTRSGNQDFVWRGKNDFTGKAGEVIFRIFDEKGTKNDRTIVYGDTDRDQQADFQIELTGIIGLTKGDFIL
ncbi:cadherin-like domain-containing protein [Rhizobium sp. GN54]|uniref:cadherin-like domain-containing protein n=1 Tax=Rhizobium sp. GN54 TaxID=2898150 RepID=UPI001E3198AF|nr:cadherin-like domain-containing protein [Rhizobium sp. GN54]MCD2185388.1 Ig-like domain-containing protein [Rhizobium sp. GN54]